VAYPVVRYPDRLDSPDLIAQRRASVGSHLYFRPVMEKEGKYNQNSNKHDKCTTKDQSPSSPIVAPSTNTSFFTVVKRCKHYHSPMDPLQVQM
jgi:hypothetical protein